MPAIAIVDGVKIPMFHNGHAPPRFHAALGGDEVLTAIRGPGVIRGPLPPVKLRVHPWFHFDRIGAFRLRRK